MPSTRTPRCARCMHVADPIAPMPMTIASKRFSISYSLSRMPGLYRMIALSLALTSGCAHAQSLEYRDTQILPAETRDQHGTAFKITGLSGITYAGGDVFWAVQDNS